MEATKTAALTELEEIQQFIDELELAEPDATIAQFDSNDIEFSIDGKAGFVDQGSLVSFVAGVSPLHQQDVLNSTLLAQLAADKKYDREKDTVEWYSYYRYVLGNVGWVIQDFDFTEFETSGQTFTVDEVVINLMGAIATGNQLAIIIETMDALKALNDGDKGVVVFNHSSHNLTKGNFQVSQAQESDGVVVMKTGAFYFNTRQEVTRLLWFDFSTSETSMYKGSQVINLNEQIYGQVRQQVIDKLGDNAKTFVDNLEI